MIITPFLGHERDSVFADITDPKQYVAMGVPYDSGAIVFRRLLDLGLREHHTLLDFGAGSLRVGRFLITFLECGNYHAIEPQHWLLKAGLEEMGMLWERSDMWNLRDAKDPQFLHNDNFDVNAFAKKFDFILISSILMHTSHAQMKEIFDTAAEALASGGMIVADYRDALALNDYAGEEWLYPNLAWHQRSCLEEAFERRWKYEELDKDLYGALWFRAVRKNG